MATSRLKKLQQRLSKNSALLLSNPGDIAYFTQFQFLVPTEREALLLVTPESATLLHASFSPVNVAAEITRVPGCNPEELRNQLEKIVNSEQINQLQIDKTTLFVAEYEALSQLGLDITSLDRALIWQFRSVKSTKEIEQITQASQIVKKALATTIDSLAAGSSELAVEDQLETALKQHGAEGPAFPTIVAFGEHTALPHHQPTQQQLKDNMAVLIDVGANYAGYCSDMTRSFWFGDQPDKEFKQLKMVVHQAYEAMIKKLQTITNGNELTAKAIDKAARSLISQHGYGKQFIHTAGHGLGLDIHEQPSLSSANNTKLKHNMVITIEPGIYLQGKFGYRYENTVLVGEEIKELTK